MAGWTGAQPRAAGGKFGQGKTAPGKPAAQPQVISGITITPAMYQQALKQAAAIIRAQNAASAQRSAALKAMTPAQRRADAAARRLQGQTKSVLHQNAARLAAQHRKQTAAANKRAAAARKLATARAAALARRPGAVAKGAAMGRSGASRPSPARAPSGARPAPSSAAVQARLQQYLAGH
jgi:hypothetical protein